MSDTRPAALRHGREASEPGPLRRRAAEIGAATVGSVLDELAAALAAAGVASSRALGRDVLAAVLDVPRSWPVANRDAGCDERVRAAAHVAAWDIARGRPFAYAVGRAWFRHHTLGVDERVLIPRPETELLVDLALAGAGAAGGVAVDVGTGSGAIALAMASEGAFDRVVAIDISLDALSVARRNAALVRGALRTTLEFRHGSLLAPMPGERARVVVSNPPYIAHHEARALPPAVRDWEPAVALYGGRDGLTVTASLVREATAVLEPRGLLALEVDTRRARNVAELVASDGRYRDVSVRLDLTGRERFVTARRL